MTNQPEDLPFDEAIRSSYDYFGPDFRKKLLEEVKCKPFC
jgi:hypothetical protein